MKFLHTTCFLFLTILLLPMAQAISAEVHWQEIKDLTAYNLEDVQGNLVQGIHFADGQGEGLVLLTESDTLEEIDEYENEVKSKELYAYGYRLVERNAHLMWRITDFTRLCDLDGFEAAFITEGLTFTDLDNNGIAEIWVPYVLSCRGDIGPMTMKIIMYEGAQKYAVRGETRARVFEDEYAGGECTLDDSFTSASPEFSTFARQLWDNHKNY